MFGEGTYVKGLQKAQAVSLVWWCLASFKLNSVFFLSSNPFLSYMLYSRTSTFQWRSHRSTAITFLATSDLVKAQEHTFIDSGLFTALLETMANKMSMADSSSHQLDLWVGGKYRLGKEISSGSFGGQLCHPYLLFIHLNGWLTLLVSGHIYHKINIISREEVGIKLICESQASTCSKSTRLLQAVLEHLCLMV